MDRAFQRIRSLMLRGTFYSVPPKRKHNFLELNNSQNRMLTKRKRKNSLHSYHNLIPSSINSNPDSRCIECRLLEKRNYRFSLVSCIFKKVLNQTLYNFIMTDIG